MDSVDADAPSAAGQELVLGHRYKIRNLAGQGGMGCVYRAWDRVLQRQVSLKKISKSEDATLRRLAELESKTLAKISHPNVLTIYDVIDEDEGLWIVAEWIEGHSLEQIIAKHGPLDSVRQLALALQFLEAIHCVHEHGIIHRDLKPANVMITSDGNLKLIDFGVAFHPIESSGATIVGSLQYTDPAILAGMGPSHSSDYYSFVITMLEATLAEKIWPELAPLPLYQHIEQHGEKHIRRLLHRLHPALALCLDKLWHLAKEPGPLHSTPVPEGSLLEGKSKRSGSRDEPTDLMALLAHMKESLTFLCPDSPRQIIATLHDLPANQAGSFPNLQRREREQATAALSHCLTAKAQGYWLSYRQRLGLDELQSSLSVPSPRARGKSQFITMASLIFALALTVWILAQHRLGAKNSEEFATIRPNSESIPNSLLGNPEIESAALIQVGPNKGTTIPTQVAPMNAGAVKTSYRQRTVQQSKVVKIHANAWADVFLGEKNLGRIPNAKGFSLPVGSHRLTLKSPYIETTHIAVQISETSQEDLRFEVPLKSKVIELMTDPSWTLEIGGRKWIKGNRHQISLKYGEHEAQVYTDSKRLGSFIISISPTSPGTLDLTKHF